MTIDKNCMCSLDEKLLHLFYKMFLDNEIEYWFHFYAIKLVFLLVKKWTVHILIFFLSVTVAILFKRL